MIQLTEKHLEETNQRSFYLKDIPVRNITQNGKKVVYTVVNGKITSKISQAPGSEQAELLLVRVYMQAAITASGEKKAAFMREVISVSESGEAPANPANPEGEEVVE